MTAILLPEGKQSFTTAAGVPLVGGKLFTWDTGTSNPKLTWADAAQTAPNTDPIILDARGEATIFWNGAYRVQLQDSTGAIIWTVDGISTQPAVAIASLIPSQTNTFDIGSPAFTWRNLYLGSSGLPAVDANGNVGLWVRTAAEIAAGVTPVNYAYPAGNVLRYGADPTGVADSTAAFNLATFATWAALTAPNAYREVFVPAGQYKINGTVYVRTGTVIHGCGMGTYIDLSTSANLQASFRLGWGLIAGVPTKDTGVLTGGYPPELYGMFFNGGPASFACVDLTFPGGLVHDCWFAAPGLAVYLAGGYFYDSEIDGGLTGLTIGPSTNQTVDNVRFFNQNVCINFDTAAGDIADCVFTSCTIEYPKLVGAQFGAGAINAKGIKFVGCDFLNNPAASVTSFSNCVSVALPNAQVEFNSCAFHNWGRFAGGAPFYAILVQAAGAVVDVKGCLFDGAVTNAAYTASTTAAAMIVGPGTLNVTDTVIRNLPATHGIGITLGGSAATILRIDGLIYSSIGAAQVVSITNSNTGSQFYAANVKGDAVTTLLNNQSTVPVKVKNSTDWFGAIGTSGASHFVLVPYQQSSLYQVTLLANQNVGANAGYRKARCDFVEKDNDFSGTLKSFVVQATAVQGAANTNGLMTLTVEFGSVGGGTNIATSNSGSLAISWPNGYTSEQIDVQLLASG